MRSHSEYESFLAAVLVGFIAVAFVFLSSAPGGADTLNGLRGSEPPPHSAAAAPSVRKWRPSTGDRLSTLENVQFALSTLGDGASYVWHRHHGRLSGVVQPTRSFVDGNGKVCRHLVLILSAGAKSGRTEAVACRLDSGLWRIDG